jgi:hypothetical protein
MSTASRRLSRKPITGADELRARDYEAAQADPLGTLHERMKAVIERGRELELWKIDNDLWQHIHDLQTEVSYHVPARPPYGRRILTSHRGPQA